MDSIAIVGGSPLLGEIPISGAKNSAIKLMAASLLTDQPLRLTNMPRLADTRFLGKLLTRLGSSVDEQDGEDGSETILHTPEIMGAIAPYELVRQMRASFNVLGPLLAAGPRRLVVSNRTHARALDLVARHAAHPSLYAVLQKTELLAQDLQGLQADFDVIVNATASSLAGGAVPVHASALKPGALAYDMMYGAAAQGFADWALAHGALPRDGLGMLVEQAAESFAFWRGVRPPSAQVLQELREALA